MVVQLLSRVQLFATPWTAAHQASLSFTISQNLLKLMSIESVMPSNHFILCCPFLLLPSVFPSIRIFSSESALCIRWPKYWSFSISPSRAYSELTSLGLIALISLQSKGTLKSLLQHHSSNVSILQCSAFFTDLLAVQRDSQESSPTPHFKHINSSVFNLLHSPTLTSIHDHRKNHSLD